MKKELKRWAKIYENDITVNAYVGLGVAAGELRKAPGIDAVPVVHARWEFVRDKDSPWITNAVCGACKTSNRSSTYLAAEDAQKVFVETHKFCFVCGARMDAEEND